MADQHRLMAEHEDQRLQQQQQQQQQQTSVSTSASTSTHSPRLSVVIGGGDPAAGEMQQQCIQSPSVVATRDHEQQTRKKTSFQITSVTVGSRASNDGGEDSADDLDESHTDDLSSELLDISKNTDEVCDIDQSPVAQTDVTAVCDASSVGGGGVGGGGGPGPGHTNVSVTVVETHTVPMAVAQHPDYQWQNRFKVVKIETGEPFRRGRWLCMNFHDPPASQGDVSEKEGTTGSGSGNSSAASSSHHGELVSGSESGQMTGGFGVASAAGGMFGGSESGFYSGEAPIYPMSIILQTQQQGGNLDFTNTVVHMQGKTPDYTATGQQLPHDYLHHHHHHHQQQQQQQQQQTLGHHVIPPHTVINPVSDFLQHQQGASLSLGSNVDYAFPPAPPDPSSPPPPHPPLAATGSVAVPASCQADYPTATSTPNPVAMPAPSAAPLATLMNPAAAPQTEYSQVAAGPATTTGAVSASSVVLPNTSVAAPVLAAAPAGQSIGTGALGQPPAPAVPVPQLPPPQQQQQQMSDGGGIGTVVRPANIPLTVNATTAESLVEASVGVLMSPQPIKEQTADGDDAESASGASTVAIDNKIEQAMDLVKSHLMFAVREEVDVLKEKITELMERISQLELENTMLRASASPETLAKLSTPAPTPSSTKTQQQPPTATS